MAQAVQRFPILRKLTRMAHVSPVTAFGIRYATAVSAAIWLGHAPGLVENQSKWILITVCVVMQPIAGGSLLKAILRAFGTLVAFFTAILVFGLFSQDPPLLLASLFLVVAVGAYGFTGPRHQYAWYVFAFTTAVILGDALMGVGQVETVAFQRASMVGLGILIVLVVDSLFWPTRSEVSLRRGLAERARQLAEALRSAVEAAPGPQGAAAGAERSAPSPLASQLGLAEAARTEIGVSRARVETLTHVALLLEALASRERVLRRLLALESGRSLEWANLQAVSADLGRGLKSALEESAQALAAGRSPSPFATRLEQLEARIEAERERYQAGAATDASLEAWRNGLHELVALLRSLEESLLQLASESARAQAPGAAPAWGAIRFGKLDPFRVQIALRSGIAVCAAVLLSMVLGWGFNNLIPPLALIVAATPTRGGAFQSAFMIAAGLLLAWLLADLGIVYFAPHAQRLPLGLLFAFAVAGTFAYVSASRPALDAVRKFGTLIALLSVYAGKAAPTDVQGSYDTMCFAALALGVGWASTRLLWPATASALFRARAADQLELCRRALVERDPAAEPAERRRQAKALLAAYTKQLAQLGSLHNQARHEPVEGSLDDARRAELLALTQDLFDAVFATQVIALRRTAELLTRGGDALAPLREALSRVDEALFASMQHAAATVRAGVAATTPSLADARDALEERIAEVRARPELQPPLEDPETKAFLRQIAWRRQLVIRQLAIEQWLSGG